MSSIELPGSWAIAPIEDLLAKQADGRAIHQGWSPQCLKEPRNGVEWGVLKTTAIQPGKFEPEHNKRLPAHLQPRPVIEVVDGDLLITCAGPRARCGVSCLVKLSVPHLMLSGKMYRFRPVPDAMDARYLEAFLQSDDAQFAIDRMKTGGSESGLNLTHDRFRRLEVRVAPFAEQVRIVEKLEELLSDLDAGIAELKAAQRKLAQYRQSLMKAALEGELTTDWRVTNSQSQESGAELLRRILIERRSRWEEKQLYRFAERGKVPPKNWKEKYIEPASPNLEDLPDLPTGWAWATIEQLSVGVTDGVHKKPDYVDVGIPFVTVRNLTAGHGISFDNLKYITPEDHAEFTKRTSPEKGDILVSKDGTLGVTRLVETDAAFSIFVSVALIKPVAREMGGFLAIAISSPVVQRQMTPKGSGLAHIHLEDLRQDCVPIPPLDEQRSILDTLERSLDLVNKQEAQLEQLLLQSAAQRKNILKTAFVGKLVSQHPNDEPASEMLARIRAERAGNERDAPRRRRKSA